MWFDLNDGVTTYSETMQKRVKSFLRFVQVLFEKILAQNISIKNYENHTFLAEMML